jgi:hypothetical protein
MNAGARVENVRDTKRFCVARRLAGGRPRGARNARNRIGETRAVVSIRLGGEGACVPFVMSSEVETSLIFPENSERFLGYARNDKKERRQGCRLVRARMLALPFPISIRCASEVRCGIPIYVWDATARVSPAIFQPRAPAAAQGPLLISNRPARAAWPRPAQIFPSSDYLDRVDARALYESPFLRPPRPPIQNSPDQRK